LPDITNQLQVPQAILDRHLRQQNDTMISQVLVRWSFLPEELSTWEDEQALRQQFPRAPAWGQAGSQGRRDVTDGSVVTTEDVGSEPDELSKKKKVVQDAEAGRTTRPVPVKKPSSKEYVYEPDWAN
jgi:hypothetical protein